MTVQSHPWFCQSDGLEKGCREGTWLSALYSWSLQIYGPHLTVSEHFAFIHIVNQKLSGRVQENAFSTKCLTMFFTCLWQIFIVPAILYRTRLRSVSGRRKVASQQGLLLFCLFFWLYWDIIDTYHCVGLRCTMGWFEVYCEMITIIALVNNSFTSYGYQCVCWEHLRCTLLAAFKNITQYCLLLSPCCPLNPGTYSFYDWKSVAFARCLLIPPKPPAPGDHRSTLCFWVHLLQIPCIGGVIQ